MEALDRPPVFILIAGEGMDMGEVEVFRDTLVNAVAFFVLAIGRQPRNGDRFRQRLPIGAGAVGWFQIQVNPARRGRCAGNDPTR